MAKSAHAMYQKDHDLYQSTDWRHVQKCTEGCKRCTGPISMRRKKMYHVRHVVNSSRCTITHRSADRAGARTDVTMYRPATAPARARHMYKKITPSRHRFNTIRHQYHHW